MSLHSTAEEKKKPTREQIRKRLKAERDQFDRKWKKLILKLEKLEHDKHIYLPESDVTVSGAFFVDMINYIGRSKDHMEKLDNMLSLSRDNISYLLNKNAEITLMLMESHAHNIESGVTVKQENNTEEK